MNHASNTKTGHIVFKNQTKLDLTVFTDASHMVHLDAKGHGGIIISDDGGTVVATKSFKMTLLEKSLTESELVAVEESIPYVLWFNLCENLGLRFNEPVYLMQDNMSAIGIINIGGSFSRSKHMIARYSFVQQHRSASSRSSTALEK